MKDSCPTILDCSRKFVADFLAILHTLIRVTFEMAEKVVEPIEEFDYEKSPDYLSTVDWYKRETYAHEVDYTVPLEYCKDTVRFLLESLDTVDKKIDWSFGAATASLAALIAIHERIGISFYQTIPSVFFLLGSAKYAILSKLPKQTPSPISAAWIVEQTRSKLTQSVLPAVEGFESSNDRGMNRHRFESWRIQTCVCAGLTAVCENKSKELMIATKMYIVAVGLLLLAKIAEPATSFAWDSIINLAGAGYLKFLTYFRLAHEL